MTRRAVRTRAVSVPMRNPLARDSHPDAVAWDEAAIRQYAID
ncbi:MAG: hypothetical protein O6930_03045 [Gammaproteobacteria bacterium]|nr:hypothetical protein [Gammaproteobacteria bacterium]